MATACGSLARAFGPVGSTTLFALSVDKNLLSGQLVHVVLVAVRSSSLSFFISCVAQDADLLMWRLADCVRGVCVDDVVEEREACVEAEGLRSVIVSDCSVAFVLDYA